MEFKNQPIQFIKKISKFTLRLNKIEYILTVYVRTVRNHDK